MSLTAFQAEGPANQNAWENPTSVCVQSVWWYYQL